MLYSGIDATVYSILTGPHVRIAAGARVKDAILMEGAFVDVSDNSLSTWSPPAYHRARTNRVVYPSVSRNTPVCKTPSSERIARSVNGDE